MKSQDEKFSADIDDFIDEIKSHMHGELSALENLAALCEQVEQKLSVLYRDKFPKTCRTCGKVFHTREDYVLAANSADKHVVQFNAQINKVQEYRNCVCGSTLMIMVPDRRDMSEFGIERRRLFVQFVDKVVEISGEERSLIEQRIREIFRRLSQKAES